MTEQHIERIARGLSGARKKLTFRVQAGRAKSDPEKLLTPGVLYCSKREDAVVVHLLAFGWWDWHISILLAVRAYIQEQGE